MRYALGASAGDFQQALPDGRNPCAMREPIWGHCGLFGILSLHDSVFQNCAAWPEGKDLFFTQKAVAGISMLATAE